MQRRWQVHPDETGVVSREALIAAFIDAATMLDIAGGCLSVVTGREPTGLPGEMVLTGAVFEWRDRTDAKPQPEAPSVVGAQTDQGRAEAASYDQPESEPDADPLVEALAEVRSDPSDENPDGFKYENLEAEDIEGQPEAVR